MYAFEMASYAKLHNVNSEESPTILMRNDTMNDYMRQEYQIFIILSLWGDKTDEIQKENLVSQ